jgi:hypothetical protein
MYTLKFESVGGRSAKTIEFESDDEAIKFALGSAGGGKVEVWRGAKMLASVDERPWRERRAKPRDEFDVQMGDHNPVINARLSSNDVHCSE